MSASPTSICAYYAEQECFSTLRERIYRWIKDHKGDWSIGEVANVLRLDKSTVSGRINELLAAGALVEAPHRKDHITGRACRPVQVAS